MKKCHKEMTPGHLTDANQIRDRVIDNVSTSDCIILPERRKAMMAPRDPASNTWGRKGVMIREAACRPDSEDEIRGRGE